MLHQCRDNGPGRAGALLLFSAITVMLGCQTACQTKPVNPHNQLTQVTIDLNKVAPIGYEVCAENPPKLARENVDLRLQMPARIDIAPERAIYGAKQITFRPGLHEVDVYKDLHSPRLLTAKGNLAMEGTVPVIQVKLPMAGFSKGSYILGISGDPFFAYCTVNMGD